MGFGGIGAEHLIGTELSRALTVLSPEKILAAPVTVNLPGMMALSHYKMVSYGKRGRAAKRTRGALGHPGNLVRWADRDTRPALLGPAQKSG